jgi:hypothetical protein
VCRLAVLEDAIAVRAVVAWVIELYRDMYEDAPTVLQARSIVTRRGSERVVCAKWREVK